MSPFDALVLKKAEMEIGSAQIEKKFQKQIFSFFSIVLVTDLGDARMIQQ